MVKVALPQLFPATTAAPPLPKVNGQGDGMEDAWYGAAHWDEAAAAAVRSEWERKRVWETDRVRVSGVENINELEKMARNVAETTAATDSEQGIGKGKTNPAPRPLHESVTLALQLIEQVKSRKAVQHGNNITCCPACDTQLAINATRCTSCHTHKDCSCRLRYACSSCATYNERAVTTTLAKGATGSLGLTFKSTLLTASSSVSGGRFIGHHINRIGAYPIRTIADIPVAVRNHQDDREVTLVFYPRYLIHDVAKGVGLGVPVKAHDRSLPEGFEQWKGRPFKQLEVFGENLMLENISSDGGKGLFRCVKIDAERSLDGAKKRSVLKEGGFSAEVLRKIYPTPFRADTNAVSVARSHTKSQAAIRRALCRLHSARCRQARFQLFTRPVEPLRDGARSYLDIVKSPMDLGTVTALLDNGLYTKTKQTLCDISQVWTNCRIFNPPTHPLNEYSRDLEDQLNHFVKEELAKVGSSLQEVLESDDEELGCGGDDILELEPSLEGAQLAREISLKMAALPKVSQDVEAIASQITSEKAAFRWLLKPRPHTADHDLVLSIVPSTFPRSHAISVLKSIDHVSTKLTG